MVCKGSNPCSPSRVEAQNTYINLKKRRICPHLPCIQLTFGDLKLNRWEHFVKVSNETLSQVVIIVILSKHYCRGLDSAWVDISAAPKCFSCLCFSPCQRQHGSVSLCFSWSEVMEQHSFGPSAEMLRWDPRHPAGCGSALRKRWQKDVWCQRGCVSRVMAEE